MRLLLVTFPKMNPPSQELKAVSGRHQFLYPLVQAQNHKYFHQNGKNCRGRSLYAQGLLGTT